MRDFFFNDDDDIKSLERGEHSGWRRIQLCRPVCLRLRFVACNFWSQDDDNFFYYIYIIFVVVVIYILRPSPPRKKQQQQQQKTKQQQPDTHTQNKTKTRKILNEEWVFVLFVYFTRGWSNFCWKVVDKQQPCIQHHINIWTRDKLLLRDLLFQHTDSAERFLECSSEVSNWHVCDWPVVLAKHYLLQLLYLSFYEIKVFFVCFFFK